ncbi:uncharacterized protein [Aegilops tauschii subsp. strangulata]|uniref:DUF7722 domain-containing protein n=3 Tax=Triticinae TaxID=1648030 RepID=A0A453SE02_AEGTS|nr:uncharacterized protein LOC109740448 [Aegilops tauschii subsp. strangulata]
MRLSNRFKSASNIGPAPSTLFLYHISIYKSPSSLWHSLLSHSSSCLEVTRRSEAATKPTHIHMGSLGPAVSVSMAKASGGTAAVGGQQPERGTFSCGFRMPLHYPRYRKADYEAMPEWRVDCLLREYGLPVAGDVEDKRRFAMGAFLWPSQY